MSQIFFTANDGENVLHAIKDDDGNLVLEVNDASFQRHLFRMPHSMVVHFVSAMLQNLDFAVSDTT